MSNRLVVLVVNTGSLQGTWGQLHLPQSKFALWTIAFTAKYQFVWRIGEIVSCLVCWRPSVVKPSDWELHFMLYYLLCMRWSLFAKCLAFCFWFSDLPIQRVFPIRRVNSTTWQQRDMNMDLNLNMRQSCQQFPIIHSYTRANDVWHANLKTIQHVVQYTINIAFIASKSM